MSMNGSDWQICLRACVVRTPAGKLTVSMPSSKKLVEIARIMQEEGVTFHWLRSGKRKSARHP